MAFYNYTATTPQTRRRQAQSKSAALFFCFGPAVSIIHCMQIEGLEQELIAARTRIKELEDENTFLKVYMINLHPQ